MAGTGSAKRVGQSNEAATLEEGHCRFGLGIHHQGRQKRAGRVSRGAIELATHSLTL